MVISDLSSSEITKLHLLNGFETFPPVFQRCILLFIPVSYHSYHPYLFSYYLVQYTDLLRRDEKW